MSIGFHTTRWTLVRHATGRSSQGRHALSELCAVYYAPVVAFLRREGRDADAARELAHEFFQRLLERPALEGAAREQGRFRSYLLGALKHFLARERERSGRQDAGATRFPSRWTRGRTPRPAWSWRTGTRSHPTRFSTANGRWPCLSVPSACWKKSSAAGKAEEFSRLKPWLTGDAAHGDQAATARELGMTEGALKVAVHRLRRRFRDVLKSEIAQTLDSPEAVADEMRHLFAALGS